MAATGFVDPRTVPSVPIRELTSAVLSKTMEELRTLTREMRNMTANNRRHKGSIALKVFKHRLVQLHALVKFGRSMGLISAVGSKPQGPLVQVESAEMRVLEQLDALRQALEGFPPRPDQSTDHVNGLRHLQYTIMLSGKSVLYDVDVALDVLARGTYSQFPRPAETFLAFPDPKPSEDDGLIPMNGSDALISRLNTALRLKLSTLPISNGFSSVTVDHGCVHLCVTGEFDVTLSTRSISLCAPWIVESVALHLGEAVDASSGGATLSRSRRYVCVPEPHHIYAIKRALTERLNADGVADPLGIVYNTCHQIVSSLALQSLYFQAGMLALATSAIAVAEAREKLRKEAAVVTKKSHRVVATLSAQDEALSAINVDTQGWGSGHLRVRYHSGKKLVLLLWPLSAHTDAASDLHAVDPTTPLLSHAGAVSIIVANTRLGKASADTVLSTHLPSTSTTGEPVVTGAAQWCDVQRLLHDATKLHSLHVLASVKSQIVHNGGHASMSGTGGTCVVPLLA